MVSQLLLVFSFFAEVVTVASIDPSSLYQDIEDGYEDGSYPEEFVQKLIDGLSPDELEKFHMAEGLDDRDGSTESELQLSSDGCYFNVRTSTTRWALAVDDHKQYFVINLIEDPKQVFQVAICNSTSGYKCISENSHNEHNHHYKKCCTQNTTKQEMYVLPIPKNEIKKNNNSIIVDKDGKNYDSSTIKPKLKVMYLRNGLCECYKKSKSYEELRSDYKCSY